MKKKIVTFLGGYILVLLLVAIGTIACCSLTGCDYFDRNNKTTVDSIQVENYVDAIMNPTFVTVDEVLDFQEQLICNYQCDSVLKTISSKKLTDIATVAIKKHGVITKKDLVREYLNDQTVYDNLPNNVVLQTTEQQTEQKEENVKQEGAIYETRYNYKDSVIDGKKVKIETKTVVYE